MLLIYVWAFGRQLLWVLGVVLSCCFHLRRKEVPSSAVGYYFCIFFQTQDVFLHFSIQGTNPVVCQSMGCSNLPVNHWQSFTAARVACESEARSKRACRDGCKTALLASSSEMYKLWPWLNRGWRRRSFWDGMFLSSGLMSLINAGVWPFCLSASSRGLDRVY